jgi:GTP-binding protein
MFVDQVRVTFQAGNGGDGVTSFRHEKFRQKGGPDGGNGGDGGDIILVASRNQNTLAAFRYKKLLKAENGKSGGKAKKHGRSAADLEVKLPIGTVVASDSGQILADLTQDGQKAVISKGGKGGFGNAHFVSSTRQAPRVAEKGEKGETFEANLELKMIADVGIVGLPNAGKSTLLSVISNARPAIANYPFTTVVPNLGVVDIDKTSTLLFADIPGLIEGASQGKGLGDEFLRHIERTQVLVHLIDFYSENIKQAYSIIQEELAAYKVNLSKRPQIVALTKIEGADKKEIDKKVKEVKKLVPRATPVLAISSASKQGIDELLRAVQKRVEAVYKQMEKEEEKKKPEVPVIGLREDDDSWLIEKTDDAFVVTGLKIERFARRTKFGDYHAEQRLHDIMRKLGIIRELERKGIEPEQEIIIGQPGIGRIKY